MNPLLKEGGNARRALTPGRLTTRAVYCCEKYKRRQFTFNFTGRTNPTLPNSIDTGLIRSTRSHVLRSKKKRTVCGSFDDNNSR